jgi:hypothetical protein
MEQEETFRKRCYQKLVKMKEFLRKEKEVSDIDFLRE